MSKFTPSDAEYIKGSVRKISELSEVVGGDYASFGERARRERDAELARLEAFIDGCTLEKGKHEGRITIKASRSPDEHPERISTGS